MRHKLCNVSSSDLKLVQMSFGQNHETTAGHKLSLCEVGT